VLLGIITIITLFILFQVRKLFSAVLHLLNTNTPNPFISSDEVVFPPSVSSTSFAERIQRIKDERIAGTAEELHPLVKNLPHDLIDEGYKILPDHEVAN
jgi:hypothetical protein